MENPETPVRILVVDDEPDIRNILHILLSSRGYEVDEAENGLRAVELVRAQPAGIRQRARRVLARHAGHRAVVAR